MILPITKIKQHQQMSSSYQLSGKLSAKSTAGIDLFQLTDDIICSGQVTNHGSGLFLVKGVYQAFLRIRCSRCLQDFTLPLAGEIEALYGNAPDIDQAGEMVVYPFVGDHIDISDVLLAEINFQLPMQPLCQRDCRGICPDCGVDLNQQTCTCAGEKIDPRWEKLKNFKFNGDE